MKHTLKREISIWKEFLVLLGSAIYVFGKNILINKGFNNEYPLPIYLFVTIAVVLSCRFFLLFNYLKRPYYLEIIDGQLLIHRDFFRIEKPPLNDIDYFHTSENYFDSSGFIKKNGWKIKISLHLVNKRHFKTFLKDYNIRLK